MSLHVPLCRDRIATIPSEEPIIWIGSGCLARASRIRANGVLRDQASGHSVEIRQLSQCFHLLADPEWVDEQLLQGCYLCTPGWLVGWRRHLNRLGLSDIELARELFKESARCLLLLDTGHDPAASERLEAFASHLACASKRQVIGLGYLKLYLRLCMAEKRLDVERRDGASRTAAAQAQAAEIAMAMDLISQLSLASGEHEVVAQIRDIFTALFAPAQCFYLSWTCDSERLAPVGDPAPTDAVIAEASSFARGSAATSRTASGEGFLLRIQHTHLETANGCLGMHS